MSIDRAQDFYDAAEIGTTVTIGGDTSDSFQARVLDRYVEDGRFFLVLDESPFRYDLAPGSTYEVQGDEALLRVDDVAY